jgi:hypothetical protein
VGLPVFHQSEHVYPMVVAGKALHEQTVSENLAVESRNTRDKE